MYKKVVSSLLKESKALLWCEKCEEMSWWKSGYKLYSLENSMEKQNNEKDCTN